MTISMLPITGVPLPLISYSGSFVLMIMFGLGIVNSVWVHRKAVAAGHLSAASCGAVYFRACAPLTSRPPHGERLQG